MGLGGCAIGHGDVMFVQMRVVVDLQAGWTEVVDELTCVSDMTREFVHRQQEQELTCCRIVCSTGPPVSVALDIGRDMFANSRGFGTSLGVDAARKKLGANRNDMDSGGEATRDDLKLKCTIDITDVMVRFGKRSFKPVMENSGKVRGQFKPEPPCTSAVRSLCRPPNSRQLGTAPVLVLTQQRLRRLRSRNYKGAPVGKGLEQTALWHSGQPLQAIETRLRRHLWTTAHCTRPILPPIFLTPSSPNQLVPLCGSVS